MKINISKDGIIEYYGNKVGYVRDNKAVVDVMFQKNEVAEFLTEKNGVSVEWKNDVYNHLLKGEVESTVLSKNCRIYQLKPETDLRMRFIGYSELKEKGFDEPNAENYRVVYDGNVGTERLEEIYAFFDRPEGVEGFDGNGIFISDIIELYDEESSEFHYINTSGFVELKDFLEPKIDLKPQETVEAAKEPEREVEEENEAEFEVIRERLDMGFGKRDADLANENTAQRISEEIQVDTFKINM